MILYLGNFTSHYGHQVSQIELLKPHLEEKYHIKFGSYFRNKILRFIDFHLKIIFNFKKIKLIIFDVYSTNYFWILPSLIFLTLFLKKDYICILRGGNLENRLISNPQLSKFIFSNATVLVAPSLFLQKIFNKYGYNSKVIYNTVSHKDFNFSNPRKKIKPKLIYVRSLMTLYNPLMAVKILNQIKKRYSDAELLMIGSYDKSNYFKIKNYVKKNNLVKNFKYKGLLSKDDWFRESRNYDIYLSTTNIDNTPVSLIEAYNLGILVASTNVGGVPFICEDNSTGILFDPNDHVLAANKIINKIESGEAEKICKNGFDFGKKFLIENVIQNWYQVINEIIE